jgi:AhpC/TSA family
MGPNQGGPLFTRRTFASALLLAAIPVSLVAPVRSQNKEQVAATSLKVGDHAPDFTLLSDQWKTVKLSDFRGKKNVFLAVYVLAFTGG